MKEDPTGRTIKAAKSFDSFTVTLYHLSNNYKKKLYIFSRKIKSKLT